MEKYDNILPEELDALDARLSGISTPDDLDVEAALKAVRSKGAVPSRVRRVFSYLPLAAAAAIAAVLLLRMPGKEAGTIDETRYKVANVDSAPMKVNLPDGSEVWLRAGSELEYGKDFGVSGRSVNLTGEAYFDVARNPGLPFYVNTPSMRVKVLGTIFNVVDRPSSACEVVLAKGSVVMQTREGNNLLRLKPGQKAAWSKEDDIFDVTEVPVGDLLLIDYGIVSVKDATAAEISSVIEESFGIRLSAEGNSAGNRYDFNFQKGASPDSVVELLNFICKDQKFTITR